METCKGNLHLQSIGPRQRYINLANQLEAVNLEQNVLIPYNTGGLKTWQAKHDLQRYRSTPKWRPVKAVPSSIGFCRVRFNTKNAYRQEEIDEIRTEWAAFVSRFV
uniref:Uncharacterized protein n=1 Tax=Cucumis melo TaxID=3656 RepID=A0A9I9E4C2_CUCME